ncbi:MAG: L,D-transpeptidase [Acidimicrobiia bacterium]
MRRVFAACGSVVLLAAGALTGVGAGALALTGQAGAAGGDPLGFVDTVYQSPDGVVVAGWTVDPDSRDPIDVHLYRDGQFLGAWKADGTRPDVAAAVPGAGPRSGFARVFPTPAGNHRFCAYAINVGPGAPYVLLGCSSVRVTDDPFGVLDVVQRVPGTGQAQVFGWALDANVAAPIGVHLYVDDAFVGAVTADGDRPDQGAAFPWSGGKAGFSATFPMAEGRHSVCAYAIGAGAGAPWAPIGCKTIDFSSTPVGNLDTARVGDSALRVTGWALDPDVTAPVDIHLYIDGYFAGAVPANEDRPDVAALYPAYGAAHGFGATLWLWPGAQQVCAYAINLEAGPGYAGLGCRALDPMPPAGSGGGRRIVYANLSQRLWLVGDDGFVDRSYPISGKYLDPPPGTYQVYAFQRYASAGHDGITMEYFVAFNPAGLGYGFHTIPTYADGTPLQSENELGFFRSAGCVRQRRSDAIFLWNWARVGDPVVLLAT